MLSAIIIFTKLRSIEDNCLEFSAYLTSRLPRPIPAKQSTRETKILHITMPMQMNIPESMNKNGIKK